MVPKSRNRPNRKRPKRIKRKRDGDMFYVPANPRPTVEFPRPDASSRIEFTLVPKFPDDHPESKVVRPRVGRSGIYNINYILSVPGVNTFNSKFDFEQLLNSGESLLQIPKGEALIIQGKDDNFTWETHFLANEEGILSRVHTRVTCASFRDAERFAHGPVSTILSYWSFLFDVAIDSSAYVIIEEATGTRKYSVGLVGRIKPFIDDRAFTVLPEYQRILAAYREGMNASNLFYKALSFYKVIEGTLTLRKKERRKQGTLAKGIEPFDINEVFPADIRELPIERVGIYDDEVAVAAFSKYLDQTFEEVRDDLKDTIRNAVAHLGNFENVLDADRYDDVVTCARAIPVLKYMSRKMLENDFEKLTISASP
jgi:hypothetical protein